MWIFFSAINVTFPDSCPTYFCVRLHVMLNLKLKRKEKRKQHFKRQQNKQTKNKINKPTKKQTKKKAKKTPKPKHINNKKTPNKNPTNEEHNLKIQISPHIMLYVWGRHFSCHHGSSPGSVEVNWIIAIDSSGIATESL